MATANFQASDVLICFSRDVALDYNGIPRSLRERIKSAARINFDLIIRSNEETWSVSSNSEDSNKFYIVCRIRSAPLIGGQYACPGIQNDCLLDNGIQQVDTEEEGLTNKEPCSAFKICKACKHV